jgi:hypothetical protein
VTELHPCLRCGTALTVEGCPACGCTTDDDANLKQELYLGYVLDDVVNSAEPFAALRTWQAASAARRQALWDANAAPVVELAPPPTIAAPPRTPTPNPEPLPVRAPARVREPPRPPLRPALSAAEARAVFERRLEVGGWFVGALFAVGGSLWATNLFWGDIPAVVRPIVVAAGLVLFAAAFVAMGGLLSARHRESVAGDVFSVVGRLIGVAATVPLASLRDQPLLVELVVDVVVLAALAMTWRAADARRKPAWSSTGWTVVVAALAVVAQAHATEPVGLGAVIATLLVVRAAVSSGTAAALTNTATWVDDLVVVSAGALAVLRGIGGTHAGTAELALVVVAGLELVGRYAAQRPAAFASVVMVRRIFFGGAVTGLLVVLSSTHAPWMQAIAWGFVAVSLFRPKRLGLPRITHLFSVVSGAVAAATSTQVFAPWLLPPINDALWATAFIAFVGVFTTQLRRRAEGTDAVWTLVLWTTCSIVGLSQLGHAHGALDVVGAVALVIAAVLWATDHRARSSAAFNLGTVFAGLLPVIVVVDLVLPEHVQTPAIAALLSTFAVGIHVVYRQQRRRPLLPLSSAATAWLAAGAVLASLVALTQSTWTNTLTSTWQVALVCTVGLVVLAELSRQLVLAVAATAVAVVLAATALHVGADVPLWWSGNAVLAVVVALAFLPRLPLRAVRAVVSHWAPPGRARHARAWAAVVIVSSSIVGLALVRVLALDSAVPIWASLLSTTLVAVALAVRHPTSRQSALALAVFIAAGAEAGATVARLVETRVGALLAMGPLLPVCAGLGAVLAAWLVAVLVVVARAVPVPFTSVTAQAPWQAPVFRRLFRRHGHIVVIDTWWHVAAAGGVIGTIVATGGALALPATEHVLLALATILVVGGAMALTLSMSRSAPLLTATGVSGVLLAPFALAQRSFVVGEERGTLLFALLGLAFVGVALVVARALYMRRPLPALLVAWPPSWSLRRPALAILAAVASIFAVAGMMLHARDLVDSAHRYGPGLIMVGVGVIATAYLALRTRRTARVATGALAVVAAAGLGGDAVAHAALWIPRSHGVSQAILALVLVGAIVVIDRRAGRALLWRVRLGWPRPVRAHLRLVLSIAVVVVGAAGVWSSAVDLPHVAGLACIVVGVAWCALALASPTLSTATVGVVGLAILAAGSAALVVEARGLAALGMHTAPVLVCAAMVALAVVQRLANRVWRSEPVRSWHPQLDVEPLGAAATVAAQRLVLVATIPLVLASIFDSAPSSAGLLATWLGFAVVVAVTSTMAFTEELTWPAALAQGMALSIYVDIRRRTPWLDDVGGIDAIACLVGAAALLAVSVLARRRQGGASTARAAEFYALTLPVVAAGFGDSHDARAVICIVGGGLYAVLARHRRRPLHELACGVAFVAAAMLALAAQGSDDVVLYLLPGSVVATYLGRRHRRTLGSGGRLLSLWCHVPVYAAAAWSALQQEDFGSFALAIVVVTVGVFYAIKVRDRRALIAASVAAAVLVLGRLLLLGLDNAALGTVLLAGLGVAVLAAMTVFTLRRDAATAAVQQAASGMKRWDDDERPPVDVAATPAENAAENEKAPGVEPGA